MNKLHYTLIYIYIYQAHVIKETGNWSRANESAGKTSGYRIRVNNSREGEIRGRSISGVEGQDDTVERLCSRIELLVVRARFLHRTSSPRGSAKLQRESETGDTAFPCRDKPGKQRFCSPGHVDRAAPSGRGYWPEYYPSTYLPTYLPQRARFERMAGIEPSTFAYGPRSAVEGQRLLYRAGSE